MSTIDARILMRRATSAAWSAANPILNDGEPGLETDTRIFKVGDGTTAWNSLPAYSTMDLVPTDTQLLLQDGMMTKSGTNILTKAGSRFTGEAVMQSLQDSTAGRALLVGAFGLGGIGNVPAASADYSTLGAVSQILADGATSSPADKPTSGRAHAGLHLASSATRWVQLLAEVAGGSDLNRLWWRRNYNGTVGAWRQLFGQGNILGAVAQASGVPTGALIEAGSNANGNYVRFADGLQICRRDYSMGARNTLGTGTLSDPYRTNQADVAFAATFAAAPMVAVTAYCDDATAANRRVCFGHRRAETTQIVQLQGVAITSEAGSGTVIASILAIGRWY